MNKRLCKKCGDQIPVRLLIDGKQKNLQNRKYCLKCSPFGLHNTRKIEQNSLKGTKICPKCNKEKDKKDFYKRRNNTHSSSYCKECSDKYSSERWIDIKKNAVEYKGGKCEICGYNKFYGALAFHHLDPQVKEKDWNQLRLTSWEKIKKELDKCICVCHNCHAEIHGNIRKVESK
jgi:predicted HNH restriction endonuclease